MFYLLDRAREPSTWAGVAAGLGALGIPLAPDLVQPMIQLATGIAALAAVLLRDRAR